MPIIVWPSDLPQRVAKENFRKAPADTRQVTPTELGLSRMGRGSSRGRRKLIVDLFLDFAQGPRFERFIEDDTAGGTQPFLFPAVALHEIALLGDDGLFLLDYDGAPILGSAWWFIQFDPNAALPETIVWGAGWRASMQFEILPTDPVLPL